MSKILAVGAEQAGPAAARRAVALGFQPPQP